MQRQPIRHAQQRGVTLIYASMAATVLLGFASMAVDLGRVQMVKTQLRRTADACARYAAFGIPGNACYAYANSVANSQSVDIYGPGASQTAFSLPASAVVVGNWTTGTGFTPNGTPTNAVRVSITSSVPLVFGQIVGMSTCKATASSTCMYATGGPGYGIVGLDSVRISGGYTDSYSSSSGAYGGSNVASNSTVASNGSINLSGSASIHGSTYDYTANGVSTSGSSSVTGSQNTLSTALSYPVASAGSAATINNNSAISSSYLDGSGNLNVPSGSNCIIPAGTYYFSSLNTSGSGMITISGAVQIYVNGKITLSGGSIANPSQIPSNLQVYNLSSQTTVISGGSAMYGQIYAPLSDMTYSGSAGFYGTMVGETITISGGGNIHQDLSAWSIGGTPGVTTVQ